MAAKSRVAAVTGGNKGIGLAIAGPLLIYLTARSPERGAEAVKTINNDSQLREAKALAQDGGDTTIEYHALDVSQTKSIQEFRDFLKEKHPEGIDILVNNAGVAMDGYDANIVKKTLETNYYGSLEATQALLPLIRKGGRLVNVSSQAGLLGYYSSTVRDAFHAAAQTDIPAVTALMQRYQAAANDGKEEKEGFPTKAYCVSKAGMTAFTKVVAMEESKKGTGVLINACCPGWVNTDMTKGRGSKTPDQGAKTPVLLALEDIGGRTGDFWVSERVSEW